MRFIATVGIEADGHGLGQAIERPGEGELKVGAFGQIDGQGIEWAGQVRRA